MVSLRCPKCGKTVQMPASSCPHCRVDLRAATAPEKPKTPFLRRLVTLVIILICLAVVYVLVKRLVTGGAFEVFKRHQSSIERIIPDPALSRLGAPEAVVVAGPGFAAGGPVLEA